MVHITSKRWPPLRWLVLVLASMFTFFCATAAQDDSTSTSQPLDKSSTVLTIRISGPINPLAAEYVEEAIAAAANDRHECLIIQLDTPGGLMESTRTITKAMLASEVPVVVYVSPEGARAASAGVFITYASHLAAMAPTTNIGAAHPVGLGGAGGDSTSTTMMEKVTNDAVAQIKTVAEKRRRNVEWAEKAVRESVSITEKEALELKVIELVAPNVDSLLALIDGRKVDLVNGTRKLRTKNADLVSLDMSWRQKLLDRISDPNIAYILMMLGIYGLFFELSNPGAIFPGVMGGIFLLLGLYALQTLPVNWAGLLLILFALLLFILEVKITSFGILTIGGIVAMFLGSVMLFKSPMTDFEPVVRVSMKLIIVATLTTAAAIIFAVTFAVRAHRRQVTTGSEGMIGEIGEAMTDIAPSGQVKVHGEIWRAKSNTAITKGEEITIVAVKGLQVEVEKVLRNE